MSVWRMETSDISFAMGLRPREAQRVELRDNKPPMIPNLNRYLDGTNSEQKKRKIT